MADVDGVNDVLVVGQPLAYGIGFAVLLVVVFTDSWGRALVTVAHEAGHMVVLVLTFRKHFGFTLADGGGGATEFEASRWSPANPLIAFAGYPLPPLLGLGGAHVVAGGNPAAVLWISLVLLVAAFFEAANPLANLVTLLAVVGVGWTVFDGALDLQAAVAVALVWLMLIGGAYYSSIGLSRGDGSDAAALAGMTLVPRLVWHAVWAVIGIVCLWKGGVLLLSGGRSAVG